MPFAPVSFPSFVKSIQHPFFFFFPPPDATLNEKVVNFIHTNSRKPVKLRRQLYRNVKESYGALQTPRGVSGTVNLRK